MESGEFGLTDTDESARYAMYFNLGDSASADVRVRPAMNLAIDREALSYLHSSSVPGRDRMSPPSPADRSIFVRSQ